MGFLASPLAKVGLTLGGSLLGNKLSKGGPTGLEKTALAGEQQAQNLGLDTGRNVLGMGSQAVQPVLNYWSSILSGNRGAMTSALAPEISRIGQGYQQAAKTSAALNPRGGPSAEFNAELPFQQQRDVSTLLQQARPAAATSLSGLGTSLLGQGSNLLYASTAAGRSILEQQQNQKLADSQRAKGIGGGLFDLISKYGFPAIDKMLKKKGTPMDEIPQPDGGVP